MRYDLQPDQPRPLDRVHVGVAPGRDVRWECPATGRDSLPETCQVSMSALAITRRRVSTRTIRELVRNI